MRRAWILGLVLAWPGLAAAGADTLVVKRGEGFGAGLAVSWTTSGNTVTFQLAAGADPQAVVARLSESLAGAKVELAGTTVSISGIPEATLLEQLSALSITGEGADPLAALAGLGPGTAGMSAPEAGGSIRASKPTANARPRIIKDHDPQERVVAEVLEVLRGTFPHVEITLKLRSSAKSGPLKQNLRRGKIIKAPVVLSGNGTVDFNQIPTQRNIGAYYLAKGDRVTIHAVSAEEGAVEIDFIERAP